MLSLYYSYKMLLKWYWNFDFLHIFFLRLLVRLPLIWDCYPTVLNSYFVHSQSKWEYVHLLMVENVKEFKSVWTQYFSVSRRLNAGHRKIVEWLLNCTMNERQCREAEWSVSLLYSMNHMTSVGILQQISSRSSLLDARTKMVWP